MPAPISRMLSRMSPAQRAAFISVALLGNFSIQAMIFIWLARQSGHVPPHIPIDAWLSTASQTALVTTWGAFAMGIWFLDPGDRS